MGFEEADSQLGMELEDSADELGDQCLLHLDPMAGHVAVEAVLTVDDVHLGVPSSGALMEPPCHVELLMQGVEGVPVVGVPVVAVDQVGGV